jgi:hypothetical protein
VGIELTAALTPRKLLILRCDKMANRAKSLKRGTRQVHAAQTSQGELYLLRYKCHLPWVPRTAVVHLVHQSTTLAEIWQDEHSTPRFEISARLPVRQVNLFCELHGYKRAGSPKVAKLAFLAFLGLGTALFFSFSSSSASVEQEEAPYSFDRSFRQPLLFDPYSSCCWWAEVEEVVQVSDGRAVSRNVGIAFRRFGVG